MPCAGQSDAIDPQGPARHYSAGAPRSASPRPHAPLTDAHIREATNGAIARNVAVTAIPARTAIPAGISAVNAPLTVAHIRGATNGAIARNVAVTRIPAAPSIVAAMPLHRLVERVWHCFRWDEGCSLRRPKEQHR